MLCRLCCQDATSPARFRTARTNHRNSAKSVKVSWAPSPQDLRPGLLQLFAICYSIVLEPGHLSSSDTGISSNGASL